MKSGILFNSDSSEKKKIVKVGKLREVLGVMRKLLSKFGKYLILISLFMVLWIFWPVIREELRFAFVQTDSGQAIEKLKNTDFTPQIVIESEKKDKPEWLVPDEKYSIYIPKIAAKSRVVSGVDPWDKESYQLALKEGVAAARDLGVPGKLGTTYLFAHSVGTRADFARYNAVFYLLHKLEKQDQIELFYEGKLYKYAVVEKLIISPSDLSYFQPQELEERLVLQTCYPPGTTWRRLIVLARPVKT